MKVHRLNPTLLAIFATSLILHCAAQEESTQEEIVVDPLVAKTTEGSVRGKKDVAIDGSEFLSFTGIPYARPPVDELRFMPPESPTPYSEDIYDATQEIPRCPQVSSCMVIGGKSDSEVFGQEDCLYLNIFTKSLNPEKLRSVMVFIHGGGYFIGHAGQYPPQTFMTKDIVLIVINYRLGALGFLSTEDDVVPGNMGLKDQQLALEWIQKNVQNFGGDPVSVTLFGESAGASSVHLQMMSPEILGKFKRVILQSGTAISSWAMGDDHRRVAISLGINHGCFKDAPMIEGEINPPSQEILECLRTVNSSDLAKAPFLFFRFAFFPLLIGPRVDDKVLRMNTMKSMVEERFKSLDMMIGVTKDEGALISTSVYADEHTRSHLKMNFPDIGPVALDLSFRDVEPVKIAAVIAHHFMGGVSFSGDQADNVTTMFGERSFWYPADVVSEMTANARLVNKKKNVFRYEFAYRGEQSLTEYFNLDLGKHWVSHADDLIYLFGKFDAKTCEPTSQVTTESDKKMSRIMVDLWTSFAIDGVPKSEELEVEWTPFTKDSKKWLKIDEKSEMVDAETKSVSRKFWQSLPLDINLIREPKKFKDQIVVVKKEEEPTQIPSPEVNKTDTLKDEL